MNNILDLVKNTVSGMISGEKSIPDDKKAQTVETATQAVGEGLKQNLSASNISNIMGLFGKNSNASSTSGNPILTNMINKVVEELVQKVGLSQNVSQTVASKIVPAVMGVVSGKVNDPNEKGFDVQSLISSFSGNSGKQGGGLLGNIGKIFG